MIIKHPEHSHWLEINNTSGLLTAVYHSVGLKRLDLLEFEMSLTVGGLEVRSPTGGLDYQGTSEITASQLEGLATWKSDREGDRCCLPIRIGEIAASFEVLFRRHGAGISISVVLLGDENSSLLIRDLKIATQFQLPNSGWMLNAPGNGLARDVCLGEITSWAGISCIGGLRGSSAVLHLGNPNNAVAVWFKHELEVTDIRIKSESGNTLDLELSTNFAGDLSRISSANIDLFELDLHVPQFADFPELFQTWLRFSGHTTPANPPAWIGSASIFEAQIGYSVFYPNHRYEPYPTVSDLTNDLDRIAKLGFKVIQLMPRQPYPSYNIHDYADIATSFGDVDQIKNLVLECHHRGIKIILDVLLHGVLDQESIGAAADGVRSGPYGHLVSSKTTDSFSTDVGDWGNYQIAWSRHIIDFEPFWKAGSPAVSPLISQHPDWFYKDSSGKVAGIYTKAFDARNPEWQNYFTNAMIYLMTELEIDGFRFDAPTYNDFPNWADWARHRASMSTLGCIPLFERLRPALKAVQSDALLYTEPSGMLLRRSMDLNYNYDEQFLVTALSDPSSTKAWGVKNARGLARWIQDRDAFLPRGAMTAHHIDSHDTFWWPSWGTKWRREQFSLLQVQLLTLMFISMPGPFMMFIGGEHGIEEILETYDNLKNSLSNWANLEIVWLCGDDVPESVFGILRRNKISQILTLVNMGESTERIQITMPNTPKFVLTVGGQSQVEGLHLELPAKSGVVVEF